MTENQENTLAAAPGNEPVPAQTDVPQKTEKSMTLDISVPQQQPLVLLTPKITVVGVGGAGGNAINNMIQSKLEGVNFVVANTDAQALNNSMAETKIQLGIETTKGQGAGARPEVGKESAEEAIEQISDVLDGANMVFITAGMGGGTGTGAAPVFARLARERDILTVGVVTKPFTFEGRHRMTMAEKGIEELAQYVDTLIVIPNQNLFLVADEKMTFADAFKRADQVLQGGVRSITDLIITPGIINLDFSDVRTVMAEMGRAMMGTGTASGENRALEAAEEAIANPLLDDASMTGAKGILINIAGGADLTLYEVDEAANRIRREVDPEANIIFGASFDSSLEGSIRVSVVATGITRPQESQNLFMGQTSTSSVFAAPASAPSAGFASAFTKPAASAGASESGFRSPLSGFRKTPAPEPVREEPEEPMTTEEILSVEEEEIIPTPVPMHAPAFAPKTSSASIPAMPSPRELFGAGETRPTPAFDPFAPKSAAPSGTPPAGTTFQRPAFRPEYAPRTEQDAPAKTPAARPAVGQQDDLFPNLTPPPVIPPAVKPAEKPKARPSLFQFVTGRKPAAPAEEPKPEAPENKTLPSDEELDIPAFLRQH